VREGLGSRDWLVYAQNRDYAEAVLAWRRGRLVDSIAGLRAVAARLREMRAGIYLGDVLFDLAAVAAESGEAAVAREAADELEALARRLARDRYRGLAATASAWASFVGADKKGAARSAGLAVELLSGTGCISAEARALDILGRSLAGADRPGSMRALEQAVSRFDAAGAGWRRDRSLEALRALGGSARRRAAALTGPLTLSRREREVAGWRPAAGAPARSRRGCSSVSGRRSPTSPGLTPSSRRLPEWTWYGGPGSSGCDGGISAESSAGTDSGAAPP